MYYLTDICCMCLKTNSKLQSVFIEDNDGIVFNEKLKGCFPEIINSTPDAHKLACSDCFERLRFLYNFKQSGIHSNTVINNYLGKLQYESKTRQQPSVVLTARKRRRKVSSSENFPEIKVENVGNSFKLKIRNFSLNSTNGEQLNTVDHSCQPTANENVPVFYNRLTEEKNLETKNEEKVVPDTETETIYIKQEQQFSLDDSTRNNLDKEVEDSEGNNFINENDTNIEIPGEEISRPKDYNNEKEKDYNNEKEIDYNNQKEIDYNNQKEIVPFNDLKSNDASNDSETNKKLCNTCEELIFKDLDSINRHLYIHIQLSDCSRCKKSSEDLDKIQQHAHCKLLPEALKNNEKFSCAICEEELNGLEYFRKHIYDKHVTSLDCVVCNTSFKRRDYLARHILSVHCRVKIIYCKLCSKRFTSTEKCRDHMIFQHRDSKLWFCKYCKKIFKLKHSLRRHVLNFHSHLLQEEEKNVTHDSLQKSVAELGNEVSASTEVEQHEVGAIAEPEEIFIKQEPQFSDEEFYTDEEFEDENYAVEKDSSDIEMSDGESNSQTSKSADLEEIIETSVISNTPAITEPSTSESDTPISQSDTCDTCQEIFLYLNSLSEHLNTHMQETSCSMCFDSSEVIRRLQRHILTPCPNTRFNEEITCVICQEKFKYSILKKHIYNHITNLTCVICNKVSSQRQNLRRHLLRHCDVKPFQCEVCAAKFTTKTNLTNHMMIMHSSQVTVCYYCPKEFKGTKSLREHIIKQHPSDTHRCEVCKRIFLHKNDLEKHAKGHTAQMDPVITFVSKTNSQ